MPIRVEPKVSTNYHRGMINCGLLVRLEFFITADPGGEVLVWSLVFQGWIGFPGAANLIRLNGTFHLGQNSFTDFPGRISTSPSGTMQAIQQDNGWIDPDSPLIELADGRVLTHFTVVPMGWARPNYTCFRRDRSTSADIRISGRWPL